ncbi:hypothetical protein TRFO_03918 [Tritrichomonas foetus]|uniref:BACK domain-containing protein n=1 Tax=Tritrichomonas foetus TaxID=1144522 RepID=A0A1J4KKC9_9EUKA|nr:hypothetical protein TRFO_03918 [Tritrichomonas foetus]|eukprot:OHT11683.1 hypothetical protein TRFO_03918 [Tritrichomonas foetus]
MENSFKLTVKDSDDTITIIYNDKIFRTSKFNFFRKCRKFGEQPTLLLEKELQISDKFSIEYFEQFIKLTETGNIEINDNNFFEIFEMSYKFGYHELFNSLKDYINCRPDAISLLEQVIQSNQEGDFPNDSTIYEKEGFLSQHLDECIKSGLLLSLPLESLFRVLCSPNRVIRDHHLLFNFVLKYIKYNLRKGNSEKVEILVSALDFKQMSMQEIKEFINIPSFDYNYLPKNPDILINSIVQMNEIFENRIKMLEKQVREISLKNNEFQHWNEEKSKKIEYHQPISQKNETNASICTFPITKYFCHMNSLDGIIAELTKQVGGNVFDKKIVDITGNKSDNSFFSSIIDFNSKDVTYSSKHEENSYLIFDFKGHQVSLTHYSIKVSAVLNSCFPRSWKLSGSNDKSTWIHLDQHINDSLFNEPGAIATFLIDPKKHSNKNQYIKFQTTGVNSRNSFCLQLNNIEFFGQYF